MKYPADLNKCLHLEEYIVCWNTMLTLFIFPIYTSCSETDINICLMSVGDVMLAASVKETEINKVPKWM